MIARVSCAALHGVDAFEVRLEVDYSRSGLPTFNMVGLAEGAVKEAHSRVFSALRNCNFKLPPGRITVNLAPADCRKAGSAYDLPLALGLLAASGIIPPEALEGYFCLGELSLGGGVRPVPGVLPVALLAAGKKSRGLIVPEENAAEAAVVSNLPVYAISTLNQAAAFLTGATPLSPVIPDIYNTSVTSISDMDFSEVKGQHHAKRAIEIAAAGGHNILFIGPPGSGKTMLSQRIPGILPQLSFDEALDVTRVYSVAGRLPKGASLLRERPFRSPHHTISTAGLIGGTAQPKPGEVSLAHRGVLFLDELPEFSKPTLEVLRQPLEDGKVTIARAAASISYPARFMLVAAMNPCPCGYYGEKTKHCICSPQNVRRYRSKISGPLLDRIDLHIEVPAVAYDDLQSSALKQEKIRQGKETIAYDSASIRQRVEQARRVQQQRYVESNCVCNAELNGSMLERYCQLDGTGQSFMRAAMEGLSLSARAYTRILRLARTIADLAGASDIKTEHLAEAIACRSLDREAE